MSKKLIIGIKKALKHRESEKNKKFKKFFKKNKIKINKIDGKFRISVKDGIQVKGVVIERNKTRKQVKVIYQKEKMIVNPFDYWFIARLGKGLEILFEPLVKIKINLGDTKVSFFFTLLYYLDYKL